MIDFLVDFTCGTISGICNCAAGYILDTLKVRMQMNPNLSMTNTFTSIVRQEGFMHLFNGIYYPLATIPFGNAVMFSSYELYKVTINKQEMNLLNGLENGAFSGLIVTFIVTPVQLIKCVMQNDKQFKFKNSRVCLRHVLRTEGIRGLFKGFVPTATRQIPSLATQFACYEYLKIKYITPDHQHLNIWQALVVGTIAAVNSWIVSYPQDIIKTKIQIEQTGRYKRHWLIPDGGFWDCAKHIHREAGMKGFVIGLYPCLLRAAIGDGIGIALYQKAQEALAPIKR